LFLGTLVVVTAYAQDNDPKEASLLARQLKWRQGSVVADIGAGKGELTLAAAHRVGATGRVYSTEIDSDRRKLLEALAAKEKNIIVLPAGEAQTNLPAACCDSIFLRLVYHHLTKPAEIDASLLQALKPGGRLAVIDMEPKPGSDAVKGVPANRGGHGVPKKIVIEELTAAGFQHVKTMDGLPDQRYCIVFRKPRP
jgi:SAM-dependent methyltransferase